MTNSINLFSPRVSEKTEAHIEIKQIIEALLFSSEEPLSLQKMKEVIQSAYPVPVSSLRELIQQIQAEWKEQKRGFQIDEIANGFLLRTTEEVNEFVELLHKDKRGEKLSKASMEVLAIIAYKQPILRSSIDKIRGVDSSGSIYSLLERGLIEVVGKLDLPGRPSQYGVTKKFLKHFGLKSIEELPQIFPV